MPDSAVTVTGPDRAAWLEARRNGIGGSDAAAVVGMHPWVSPLGLYFDKTGEVEGDQEPTEAMEWGIRLERVVCEAWSEKNGKTVKHFPPYDPANILRHPDHPWMLANLDGVVVADNMDVPFGHPEDEDHSWQAIYEGKTASGWTAHDWDEGVPPYVLIQVQWQLAVTGLDVGYVACLVGGQRFVQDEVRRDDEMIAGLIVAGEQFWDHVQRRQPPAVDAHPNTADVLKARWTDLLDDAVELGTEGIEMNREWHEAKPVAKAAADRLATVENRIRMAMGEHQVMTVFGEIAATWKADKNGTRRLQVKEIV